MAGKGNSTVVRMCPATEYWQDKMVMLADKIVNEDGFDGIYYDMVAAVPAEPCFDRSHDHPMGGGHHYQNGNSKFLHGAKKITEKK